MNYIRAILFLTIITSFSSCLSSKISRELKEIENEFQDHVGFIAIDASSGKELVSYQSDRYFTPASNTKILTLYSALRVLGDSIPSLYYIDRPDSLIFWGSGDPSFLNPKLPQSEVYNFLKSSDKDLYFSDSNFSEFHFGPGWAWDDYPYQFSAERMPLPVFGNVLNFVKNSHEIYPKVFPKAFKRHFYLLDSGAINISRDYSTNDFYYRPDSTSINKELSFRYNPLLTASILSDTLKKNVRYTLQPVPEQFQTIYHPYADSIYMEMMKQSDNMVAEHLMLIIGGKTSGKLSVEKGIEYVMENYLHSMPDRSNWRDGSGLSRYNLITPRSIAWLWKQLYNLKPEEELFSLLAQGGRDGTLKNYYDTGETYLFGKTGTLSNVHNLSGYLRTSSGKLVIFSFMNNNYPGYSAPVKKKIEKIINEIYAKY